MNELKTHSLNFLQMKDSGLTQSNHINHKKAVSHNLQTNRDLMPHTIRNIIATVTLLYRNPEATCVK